MVGGIIVTVFVILPASLGGLCGAKVRRWLRERAARADREFEAMLDAHVGYEIWRGR